MTLFDFIAEADLGIQSGFVDLEGKLDLKSSEVMCF